MSRLAAGSLNRRVTIERKTEVANGAGGFDRSWSTVTTVWAKATPIGGKEAVIAGTLQVRQPWRIEIRFRTDLLDSAAFRLRLDGRPLNILSASDPDGDRSSLLIFAETEFE